MNVRCAVAAAPAPRSQAGLIDGGSIHGARYAGLAIHLEGAAVTYWRNPGDAGAAPKFDFAHSENVAEAEALYPQPERIDEEGAQAFGYRRDVVFPIRFALRQKDKPAVLALSVDYAICDKLCLPAHADMRLNLPPDGDASSGVMDMTEALAKIPRRLPSAEAGAFAQVSARPGTRDKPQWLLRIPSGVAQDVFIEAPKGFYVESAADPTGAGAFLLTLVEHPSQQPMPDEPVRVTVAGPSPAEFDLALPKN